jgi:hypothetical protein
MEQWQERFAETVFRRASATSHDLKTPLNIAVLNLELLRMRVRKVSGEDDPKIRDYTRAVELELRRLASIFDAFFINAVPPGGDPPGSFDAAPLLAQAAEKHGFEVPAGPTLQVRAHPARIAALASLFFEGASRLLDRGSVAAKVSTSAEGHAVRLLGRPIDAEPELGKLFKFYYTDASGAPDLALATSRLIAETYGGAVEAAAEGDLVQLDLYLPQGER